MWLYLCLTSAIFSGFTSVVMKKCSKNNNSISLALIGMIISDIAYVILGVLMTNVISSFNIINLIKIAPLTIIQALGYISGILAVKYASVSTVAPIRKGNTVVTLVLGILILKDSLSILQLILSIILIILTILLARGEDSKKNQSRTKGIIAAYSFVLFNGIAGFLNKLYINIFHDPLIVVFYYGLMGIILIFLYCAFTNNWRNLNIYKINFKEYFLLHSLLDLGANLCQRFSLIEGQVSTVSVIRTSTIKISFIN
ncbi:MAG: EamA family transporter [Clostridia bacterium]|nr:EamA family transporter [Clostridia bacterium]